MLLHGHQHFPSHVPTLLRPGLFFRWCGEKNPGIVHQSGGSTTGYGSRRGCSRVQNSEDANVWMMAETGRSAVYKLCLYRKGSRLLANTTNHNTNKTQTENIDVMGAPVCLKCMYIAEFRDRSSEQGVQNSQATDHELSLGAESEERGRDVLFAQETKAMKRQQPPAKPSGPRSGSRRRPSR